MNHYDEKWNGYIFIYSGESKQDSGVGVAIYYIDKF